MNILFVGRIPLIFYYVSLFSDFSNVILYTGGIDFPEIREENVFKMKIGGFEKEARIDGVTTDLMDLVEEKFDIIFFVGYPAEVVEFIKEFNEAKIESDLIIIGCDGIGLEDEFDKDVKKKISMARILTDTHINKVNGSIFEALREEPIYIGFTNKRNGSKTLLNLFNELKKRKIRAFYYDDLKEYIWRRSAIISIVDTMSSLLKVNIKFLQESVYIRNMLEELVRELEGLGRKIGINMINLFRDLVIYIQRNGNKKGIFLEREESERMKDLKYFNEKIIEYGQKFSVRLPNFQLLTNLLKAAIEIEKFSKL